ncbi:MAG: hypothetical protein ACI8VW_000894 [bacterium]|jgi:hypothetical protein
MLKVWSVCLSFVIYSDWCELALCGHSRLQAWHNNYILRQPIMMRVIKSCRSTGSMRRTVSLPNALFATISKVTTRLPVVCSFGFLFGVTWANTQ